MGDGGLALSFLFHGGDLPGRDRRRGHRRSDPPGARCSPTRLGGGPRHRRRAVARHGHERGTRACGWTSTSRTAATTSTPSTRRTRCTRCSGSSPAAGNGAPAVSCSPTRTGPATCSPSATSSPTVAGRSSPPRRPRPPGATSSPRAPTSVLDDASLVASAFVNLFGPANAGDVGADDRAATGAARILGAHMYGVQHALGSDSTVTDGERIARARRRRPSRGHAERRAGRGDRRARQRRVRRAAGRRRCSTRRRSRRSSTSRRAPTPASPALRGGLSRVPAGGRRRGRPTARLAERRDPAVRARRRSSPRSWRTRPGSRAPSSPTSGTRPSGVGGTATGSSRSGSRSIGEGIGLGASLFGSGRSAVRRRRRRRRRRTPSWTVAGRRRGRGRRSPTRPGWADLAGERLAYLWIARAARGRPARRRAATRDPRRRRAAALRRPRRDAAGRRPAGLGGDDRDPAARRVDRRRRRHRRRGGARRHARPPRSGPIDEPG